MMRRLVVVVLFSCYMIQLPAIQAIDNDSNAVLIFLDDSEKGRIGAITQDFLSAFIKKTAPIIVSASIVKYFREANEPQDKNPKTLHQTAQRILHTNSTNITHKDNQTLKDIFNFALQFDRDITQNWIIKKINESLYLLLPNAYLQSKEIIGTSAQAFSNDNRLTETEKKLGLKINHMETVDVNSIAAPLRPSPFEDSLETIFIKTRGYSQQDIIPSLVILMTGHGALKREICGLSIRGFKIFLSFLTGVSTKLLVYGSCYAAGTNTQLIYHDTNSNEAITYNFPIIAMALTDTITEAATISTDLEHGKIKVISTHDYSCFIKKVTSPEVVNYNDAIQCINYKNLIDVPQIRYPGLPWFSILNTTDVVSIGSIMAKARTSPLPIATFFAKQGQPAHPLGILLYAQEIPFEVIVNTTIKEEDLTSDAFRKFFQTLHTYFKGKRVETCYVPRFVSMIPGDMSHYIKKISSSCNTADDILQAFYLESLASFKTFVIGTIAAPFSQKMKQLLHGTTTPELLSNVVVNCIPNDFSPAHNAYHIYFMYNNTVYFAEKNNTPAKATAAQQEYYASLLQEHTDTKLQEDDERRRHQAQQSSIEKQSIYKSLTPEAVAKIRPARGKKDEISTPVQSINPFYKAATKQPLNRKQSPQEPATVQETEISRSEETTPIVEGLD